MCDEFGENIDVSDDTCMNSDVSCEEGIDFETVDDVYEADRLDEIEILEENGDTHTVAEQMEALYGENPVEVLTPAQEGLREFEESSQERIEEIREHKEALTDLRAALIAGDADALELFGLETPDTSEEEGHQKILTR